MKILVTSTFLTPFILEDLNILRKHHDVEHLLAHGTRAPVRIAVALRRADLVYSWFASTYAAVAVACARAQGKKSIIALGGADVAGIDEIGYGIWVSSWKSRLCRYALRHADRILAMDPFLKQEAVRRARYDGANIQVLPTGFDAAFWSPGGAKEKFVLSVALCDTEARLQVKGVDMLLEAARRVPDLPFILVGIESPLLESIRRRASSNVEVRTRVPREELRSLYRRAKVYCQSSRVEGFGAAVCEAMLCGCVPVGTNLGGMNTTIGERGFLVTYGDAPGLAEAITKAMAMPADAGIEGRRFIAEKFSLELREKRLLDVMTGLLG